MRCYLKHVFMCVSFLGITLKILNNSHRLAAIEWESDEITCRGQTYQTGSARRNEYVTH